MRAAGWAEIACGAAADDADRWVVERVLEVDQWHGALNFRCRVEWGGVDPATGTRWEPSWTHASWLTASVQDEAVELYKEGDVYKEKVRVEQARRAAKRA